MAHTAYLPIIADRYGALVRHIFVVGLDLTGIDMRAQVRLYGDVPGAPLVDLLTVANGNAQGLRLVEVTSDDAGLPTSHIELVINETTMEALPYAGEIGDVTTLAWDWQITIAGRKRRLAKGEFQITGDGVTGAEVAPINRIQPYGLPQRPVADVWSSARMTFGEEQVSVQIDGADLIAPFAKKASDAADSAEADATLAGLAAASAQAVTRYFTTRAAGETASIVDQAFATDDGAGNVIYYRRTAGGSVEIGRAVTPASLRGDDGADQIGFRRNAAGAVPLTVAATLTLLPLTAQMFGAVGDGAADDTAAIQAMVDYAKANGRDIRMTPGIHRISDSIRIDKEVKWNGAGASLAGTRLVSAIADPSQPLIDLNVPVGKSCISGEIGNMILTTEGSYNSGYTRRGIGLRLTTAPGHIINNSWFHDLNIFNHSVGVDIGGVVYQCNFQRIKVSADSVVPPGIPIGPNVAGFQMGITAYQDITYNTFSECEVTNVRNGGYAWRGSSQFSNFLNCTADGPVSLTSIGGTAIGFTVEGWTQDAGAAPINAAMLFDRFATVLSPVTRALPAGKVGIGVQMQGDGWLLSGYKNFDGPLPATPIYLDGVGMLVGISLPGAVNRIPPSGAGGLNGSVAINCETITDHGFGYVSEMAYLPTFATWSTLPSISGASASQKGNEVTIYINGNGGVIPAGAEVGSLPAPASVLVGSVASLAAADGSKNLIARIQAGDDAITGLPARDLTGQFWQLTATYRRAL